MEIHATYTYICIYFVIYIYTDQSYLCIILFSYSVLFYSLLFSSLLFSSLLFYAILFDAILFDAFILYMTRMNTAITYTYTYIYIYIRIHLPF